MAESILNKTPGPTIAVTCSCRGHNRECVICRGVGTVTRRSCSRCGGTGVEGSIRCIDCRGEGWRDVDMIGVDI